MCSSIENEHVGGAEWATLKRLRLAITATIAGLHVLTPPGGGPAPLAINGDYSIASVDQRSYQVIGNYRKYITIHAIPQCSLKRTNQILSLACSPLDLLLSPDTT